MLSPIFLGPWYNEFSQLFRNINYIYIIVVIFILYLILSRTKKEFHSHWNTLIPEFKFQSKEFYSLLKKEILSKQIHGIRTTNAVLREGGVASSSRLYLRIHWKNYQYDICCAPFGDGLFLSSWLVYKTSIGQILISKIPFIGGYLQRKFYKITYYKIDSASMFMTYCHNALLKVADDITKESGTKISKEDRKPILKDIFKR
tara:strand:- start:4860 stop:5465 length:606 start_codon:yes stop_codon:yes gene_type:complete